MSKLKTADEYLNDNNLTGSLFCRDSELNQHDRDDFIHVIEQVQIDTKSKCIEEVERQLDENHWALLDVEKLKEIK